MGFRNNIDADFYLLQLQNTNNIEARFRNNIGVSYDIIANNVLSFNQWQHLAFTYDGSYIRLYKDGLLLDSTLANGVITQTNESFMLGSLDWQGTGFYMNGKLDEIRIWDTNLSANEISTWMCSTINSNHPYFSNLLACWKLDEGTGNTIFDYFTFGNPAYSGTISGSTTWQLNSNCTNVIMQNLCDSININFTSTNIFSNPGLINFNLNVLFNSNYWFGYCGFVLLNNNGDTIAYENINTAGNVFGIGPATTESRSLEIIQNITTPFYGELHLIEGYFAGSNLNTQCIFPFDIITISSWDCVSPGNCQDPGTGQGTYSSLASCQDSCLVNNITDIKYKSEKLQKIINVLGKETLENSNQILFFIYEDGTMGKKIIIE